MEISPKIFIFGIMEGKKQNNLPTFLMQSIYGLETHSLQHLGDPLNIVLA